MLLVETVFLAIEKVFFHLSDIPGSENSFSQGIHFLTNSSFLIIRTNYLSSRNSIVLFRALLKILKFDGSSLFKRKPYFCSWKLIFWLVGSCFVFENLIFFLQVETFTEISGNKFIWEKLCSGRKRSYT